MPKRTTIRGLRTKSSREASLKPHSVKFERNTPIFLSCSGENSPAWAQGVKKAAQRHAAEQRERKENFFIIIKPENRRRGAIFPGAGQDASSVELYSRDMAGKEKTFRGMLFSPSDACRPDAFLRAAAHAMFSAPLLTVAGICVARVCATGLQPRSTSAGSASCRRCRGSSAWMICRLRADQESSTAPCF